MTRLRMFAISVALICVVAIASYYLFGGRSNIAHYFPAPSFYVPNPHGIPSLRPATPGPLVKALPKTAATPLFRYHPSMRTPTRTDALLHTKPPAYLPSTVISPVTPPPAPTYAPVTPPPYAQAKPIVQPPQPGVPLPGQATPSPVPSP